MNLLEIFSLSMSVIFMWYKSKIAQSESFGIYYVTNHNNGVAFLLLSFKNLFYNLDISSVSDICLINIFSHFMACLFNLLLVSFGEQKF